MTAKYLTKYQAAHSKDCVLLNLSSMEPYLSPSELGFKLGRRLVTGLHPLELGFVLGRFKTVSNQLKCYGTTEFTQCFSVFGVFASHRLPRSGMEWARVHRG